MAKKGQKFKIWSAEEKYKVIKPIIDLEVSLTQVGKETGISNSMLHSWTKLYKEKGLDGLKNKKKPGNPLVKYSKRKSLTKEEQLEYETLTKEQIDYLVENGKMPEEDDSNLEALSITKLREMAKEKNIEDYDRKTKAEILKELNK